ncbi:AsmA family protein [Phenylobacterium sp.]|uniref:AsmA family protein n=1 Tax=Phenylobacterium sp. TaxID=1871053 RepID=UPI00286D959C|nr:AsmA family protein [Phenylobacterium sp.]
MPDEPYHQRARSGLIRARDRAADGLRRAHGAMGHGWERARTRLRQTKLKRPSNRALAWTGGIVGALVAAIALFLILFDWNYLRGPIGRYASAKTGREIVLAGNLDVDAFSFKPSATVEGIRVGNPKWAGPGQTADIKKLDVQVKLMPLLVGQVVLLNLELNQAKIDLRRDLQGRATWDFSNGKKSKKPFKMPPIRRFVINDGHLRMVDEKRKLVLNGQINATEEMGKAGRGFLMTGDGSLNGNKFLLRIQGGPLLNVDARKPYPFDADIRAGATRVTAKGSIPKPFDLAQFSMNVTARGPDLAALYDLTGVALPNTPPYRLNGRLSRDESLYKIEGLGGRVGDSDLSGFISVETGDERPYLKADLRTRSLDFDDLAAVFGGAPSRKAGETVSPEQAAIGRKMAAQRRLLPDTTLNVSKIRSLDADVRYRVAAIRDAMLPLRSGDVTVKLERGLLSANPLTLDLPQGKITGQAHLNARGETPVTEVDVRLSNARLEQLIPIKGEPLAGSFVGRIKLKGAGNSVHRAAANADGEVLAVVPSGEIREAFAELLGINAAKGLGLLFSKDQGSVPIRCGVAHFQARNGVLTADRIVFDTKPVLATGGGTINLDSETMDLRIQGKSKELRLVRLLSPITVKGPLLGPKVGIETGKVIAQGGVAVALAAVVNPLALLLPFIDPGLAKDASCASLIAEAGREGAPVKTVATKTARR